MNKSKVEDVPNTYITKNEDLESLARLRSAKHIAVDTETVSEKADGTEWPVSYREGGPGPCRVISVAAFYEEDDSYESWVIDLAKGNVDPALVAPYFEGLQVEGFYASFDEHVLGRVGIVMRAWDDWLLARRCLVNGSTSQAGDGLAVCARQELDIDVTGKGGVQLSYTEDGDLSDDQIAYAAQDAIVTLWLGEVFRTKLREENLVRVYIIERAARKAFASMEQHGFAFDSEGWLEYLENLENARISAHEELALATGGGRIDAVTGNIIPTFNAGSSVQVRQALNTFSPTEVRAYLKASTGKARLLEPGDTTDKTVREIIGGPVCAAMQQVAKLSKMDSTYGEEFVNKYMPIDNRVRPGYRQMGTATGRASSSKPNGQNLPPEMKYFMTSPDAPSVEVVGTEEDPEYVWTVNPTDRVAVIADLSQAELRFAGHLSGEAVLRESFESGADLHQVTAGRMFDVDMDELEVSDPEMYSMLRDKAKTANFSCLYGIGAVKFGQRLTAGGQPTSKKEAQELITAWLAAYPDLVKWMDNEKAKLETVAKAVEDGKIDIDWGATLKVLKISQLVKGMAKAAKVNPDSTAWVKAVWTDEEILEVLTTKLDAEPTDEDLAAEVVRRAEVFDWYRAQPGPVVLLTDGTALVVDQHTGSGRRRRFNVSVAEWIEQMVSTICRAKKQGPMREARDTWMGANPSVDIYEKGSSRPKWGPDLVASFDGILHMYDLVRSVAQAMGNDTWLFRVGAASALRRNNNAYKNMPIQGGVADAVVDAFGTLGTELPKFKDAYITQSVHDSIFIECYASDALEVAELLERAMKESAEKYCTTVPIVVDANISVSAAEKGHTIIPRESFEAFNKVPVAA